MRQHAKQRSAVTNGTRFFLAPGAGNGEEARRYRDLFGKVLAERGGEAAMPTTAVEACRTWAGLAVLRETMHAKLALGEAVDPEALGQIGDRMARQERLMGKPLPPPKFDPLSRYARPKASR